MSAATTVFAAAVERQATGLCGKAAHAAAAPYQGRNAADVLTVAQVAVGLLRQHLESRQMLHGIVTHGGAAPNIVPANTSALYYLCAPDVESLQQLETRVWACFEAGALATGCAHEVTQVSPVYTDFVPDPWLAPAYRVTITGLSGLAAATDDAQRDRLICAQRARLISRAPGVT